MLKRKAASLLRWLDGRGWKADGPVRAAPWVAPEPVAVDAPPAWSPSPAVPETPAVDRRTIAKVFDSAHPVRTRNDLFGREAELDQLLGGALDTRRHLVIHGARGSGKTSLVRIFGDHADQNGAVVLYFACEPDATFADLMRPYLESMPSSAFSPGARRDFEARLAALPPQFGPRAFVDLVAERIPSTTILILDEFDRISDDAVKSDVAAAMKLLSDAMADTIFVLVGIARTVTDVVGAHPSLRRHMRTVALGRIPVASAAALIDHGEELSGIRFAEPARRILVDAACGSPYHLRMFAQHAALAAAGVGGVRVEVGHVREALVAAFGQWADLNEADARIFARAMQTCNPPDCAELAAIAREAATSDVVVIGPERAAAAQMLGGVLQPEPGEPDAFSFRDSTAPQMLLALLLTTGKIATPAFAAAEESDFAPH